MFRSLKILSALIFTFVTASVTLAQDVPKVDAPKAAPAGTRRVLIICGLTGDAEHHRMFSDTVELLNAGLTTLHGFKPENIQILWGDKPDDKDPPVVRRSTDIATRESITKAVEALRAELQPADTLWVFVFGHAHFDGKASWLNLEGPDFSNLEFGRLFVKLVCQEQIFFITTPCSGYYHKPLAQLGRVVITATEADIEVNSTRFPQHLAKTLSSPPEFVDFDRDLDGLPTLLDLYLWTVLETAQEYAGGSLLATEHALLDDSGDGRGTEIQVHYLPEELGGQRRPPRSPRPPLKSDGKLARQIPIAMPPPPLSPAPPELPMAE